MTMDAELIVSIHPSVADAKPAAPNAFLVAGVQPLHDAARI
jgi:hypothetical protein